jgi:hypothetical protein
VNKLIQNLIFASATICAAETDYNSCQKLGYRERNDCLLGLSRSQAIAANDPEIFHNSNLGLDFYYSMFLEGTNYFRAGQQFATAAHPFWNWDWTARSQLQVDYYVTKVNGTGNQDSGSVGWGRPGVGYRYRTAVSATSFTDAILKIRFPFYDLKYEDVDVDPHGRREIWEISLENIWNFKTDAGNNWEVGAGVRYNTDKSYDVSCDPSFCGIDVGRIDQRPTIGYLSAGYIWRGNWDLGVSVRTEQTLITGRTQYLGTGDELRDYVSVSSNSLSISAENKISDSAHLKFLIVKSIIENHYDRDYINQNFENPIYGSNLGVGMSLWWDL